MILSVILCCVIIIQIEARTITPPYIMGQERGTNNQRIREQNDAYGSETIQLNGRSPRAPSWPKANSNKDKMFLLPKILETEDQINITLLISRKPQRVTISLMAERNGLNGTEPDYNNTASQLNVYFTSNNPEEQNGSIVLKTIKDEIVEEIPVNLPPSDLIPDFNPNEASEVTIGLHMTVDGDGYYEVKYYMGESYVDKIKLKHMYSVIRYITIDGDVNQVKRLDFIFGSN